MHDIDDLIADDEEESSRSKAPERPLENSDLYPSATARTEVGEVERFFSKVSVAAIHLNGDLRVGDTIEIDGDEGPIRVEVSGMQIDRVEVESAVAGDSVGIKVDTPVKGGQKVYRL